MTRKVSDIFLYSLWFKINKRLSASYVTLTRTVVFPPVFRMMQIIWSRRITKNAFRRSMWPIHWVHVHVWYYFAQWSPFKFSFVHVHVLQLFFYSICIPCDIPLAALIALNLSATSRLRATQPTSYYVFAICLYQCWFMTRRFVYLSLIVRPGVAVVPVTHMLYLSHTWSLNKNWGSECKRWSFLKKG